MTEYKLHRFGPYTNVLAYDPRPGRRPKWVARFAEEADAVAFVAWKMRQQREAVGA